MNGNPVLKDHMTLLPQFLEMPSNPPFPLPEAENSIFILGGLATKLSIKLPEPALLKVLSSVHFIPCVSYFPSLDLG